MLDLIHLLLNSGWKPLTVYEEVIVGIQEMVPADIVPTRPFGLLVSIMGYDFVDK